ncbi:MAG: hypothetical protein ABI746_08480 [Dermatophilaceae bacterium]
MTALFEGLGIVHIAVAALIIAGFALSLMGKTVSPLMVWAARVQLLLGLALVGIAEGGNVMSLNHTWIAVKLLVAIGVVACTEMAARRAARDPERFRPVLLHVAAGLTLINILYAYTG